ncbi:MAG TPA: hypothetical protein PLE30_00035 [Candidatus Kapabacteria bacterium]|nr:hypothetical protein [Candidatus Kapabacteria bacterium]
MNDKTFDIVNKHVSIWNILNLPEEIAIYEYTDFVPLIIEFLNGNTESLIEINSYISDLIGIGFENSNVLNDFNILLQSIRNELII